MPLHEKIGIESEVLGLHELSGEMAARARFRIAPRPDQSPPGRDGLDVKIAAWVFDRNEIEQRRVVPSEPLAKGTDVNARATMDWSEVTLQLPPRGLGLYSIAAKVVCRDERYPHDFDPSNCYLGVASYGDVFRMRVSDLSTAYSGDSSGTNEEIRSRVRRGEVIAVDENGHSFFAREENGVLKWDPLSY